MDRLGAWFLVSLKSRRINWRLVSAAVAGVVVVVLGASKAVTVRRKPGTSPSQPADDQQWREASNAS